MPVDQPTDHPTGQINRDFEGMTLVPESQELAQGEVHLVRPIRRNAHFLNAEYEDEDAPFWGITQVFDSPEVMPGQVNQTTARPSAVEALFERYRNQVAFGVPQTYDHDGFDAMIADAQLRAEAEATDNHGVPATNQVDHVATQVLAPIAIQANVQGANRVNTPASQVIAPIATPQYMATVDERLDELLATNRFNPFNGSPDPTQPRILPIGAELISLNNGRLPSFHLHDQYTGPGFGERYFAGVPLVYPTLRFSTPGPRRYEEEDKSSVTPPRQRNQQIWTVPRVPQEPRVIWCKVHQRQCLLRNGSSLGSDHTSPNGSPFRSSGRNSEEHIGVSDLRTMIEAFSREELQEEGIHLFGRQMFSHDNPANFDNNTGYAPRPQGYIPKGKDWFCKPCVYDNFGRNWKCKGCHRLPPPGYGARPPLHALEAIRIARLNGTINDFGIFRNFGDIGMPAQHGAHPEHETYLGAEPMNAHANSQAGPSGYNGGTTFDPRYANRHGHQRHHHENHDGNGDANGNTSNHGETNGQGSTHANANGPANGHQHHWQHQHGAGNNRRH